MIQLVLRILFIAAVPLAAIRVALLSAGLRQWGAPVWPRGEGLVGWRWGTRVQLMPFVSIAFGKLQALGPALDAPLAAVMPAGVFSPDQLRAAMGIDAAAEHDTQAGSRCDAEFFQSATALERLMLVLRSLLALFYGNHGGGSEAAVRVFGVQFRNTSMQDAVGYICEQAQRPDGEVHAPMKRVFFVNADCLNQAYRDRDYHYLLHDADLVLPDGSGVRLGLKWLGTTMQDNLNGTDLFPPLCAEAARQGLTVYLLGGKPGIAAAAAAQMQARYPALNIAGTRDGYFDDNQAQGVVDDINASGADILLLGMGAPRQERWLSDHAEELRPGLGIGVGGLFDYYSGAIARAPLWLRELGLEWVWRIVQEPGEKWRRYVVGNPLFLSRVLRQRWSLGQRSWTALDGEVTTGQWNTLQSGGFVQSLRSRLSIWRWRFSLGLARTLKRGLDLSVAGLMILLLSPLLAVLAAIVKLTSPGPITYHQTRIGERGQPFTMHKFRSMYCDADQRLEALRRKNESADGVLFKMANDPRITPVGRWMRRFSIDELPQLFNVLNGSMSLVGPRPALPSEVDAYQSAHLKRLQGKPGLTCWWQVSGRSDLSFSQQIELDMKYMSNQSIGEDLRLLARTVPAVISGKGAY